MRTVSADFRRALYDESTGEVIVLLLTIAHPDLAEDIYLSSDNAVLLDAEQQLRGTMSRGIAFSFMPMELALPEDGDEAAPTIQATFYDVALELTPLLESSTFPASVTAEIVRADAPNAVEVAFVEFQLTSADIRGGNVTLSLAVDVMAAEPFPADTFTPSSFPGLWADF